MAHQMQMQQHLQQQAAAYTILQLDKSTQTDESCIAELFGSCGGGASGSGHLTPSDILTDTKTEKTIRQRLQRVQRGGEHSVSSQTLSPMHSKF